MNNKHSLIYKIPQLISSAFAISSFVTLGFFIFMKLYTPLGTDMYGMSFSAFLCIIIFSLVITFARLIFTAKNVNKALAWAINYITICAAFFVIFSLSNQVAFDSPAEVFVGIFLFSFCYLLVVLVNFLIKKFTKKEPKKSPEKKPYVKQF